MMSDHSASASTHVFTSQVCVLWKFERTVISLQPPDVPAISPRSQLIYTLWVYTSSLHVHSARLSSEFKLLVFPCLVAPDLLLDLAAPVCCCCTLPVPSFGFYTPVYRLKPPVWTVFCPRLTPWTFPRISR